MLCPACLSCFTRKCTTIQTLDAFYQDFKNGIVKRPQPTADYTIFSLKLKHRLHLFFFIEVVNQKK